MKKRLILKTISRSLECTIGALVDGITGLPVCLTLERPNLGNKKNVSCIPRGMVYECTPHGDAAYRVKDVPGRTLINVEIGNKVKDTKGCILVGLQLLRIKDNQTIMQSANAMTYLKKEYNDGFILQVE